MMVLMIVVLTRFCSHYLCDYDGTDDYDFVWIIFVIKMVLMIIVRRIFCLDYLCDYDGADDNSSEKILF